jgi:hypothetical protein
MAINSTFYLDAADLVSATSVYLDLALLNIAPDGFYREGAVVREQSSGILLASTDCEECPLKTALRSEVGVVDPETTNVCLELLEVPVYILTGVDNDITSGDIVCNSNDPLDTFDGGGLYYRLALDSSPTNDKVCLVSSVGVINVYLICS